MTSATPTKSQYFFAASWPARILLGVFLVLSLVAALWACEPGSRC